MTTQIFDFRKHDQHDTSKTLSIANQSETSIQQYHSVTSFSTIETKSSYFLTPFVVADIKQFISGTPFSENYVQKLNIKIRSGNSNILSMTNPPLILLLH